MAGQAVSRFLSILIALLLIEGCVAATPEPSSLVLPTPLVIYVTPAPTPQPTVSATTAYDHVNDLVVGDCFDRIEDKDDATPLAVVVLPCDSPHGAEMIGLAELGGLGESWPGEPPVIAQSESQCLAAFKAYVGIDFELSALSMSYYPPTAGTWPSGDRNSICFVLAAQSGRLEGSVRDARR